MPFRLTASETVSYNSNIFAVPTDVVTPSGQTRGDFTSQSSFGVSTKANWYDQSFFLDGNSGVLRYLHQVDLGLDFIFVKYRRQLDDYVAMHRQCSRDVYQDPHPDHRAGGNRH